MTLIGKLAVGAAGLILAGGGTWGSYLLTQPKNVRDQLISEGENPLNMSPEANEDQEQWKEIIKKWTDNSNELSSFVGSTQTGEEEKIKALKNKCQNVMETPKSDKDFATALANAKKYCVKKEGDKQ